jgi:hypothetical protein
MGLCYGNVVPRRGELHVDGLGSCRWIGHFDGMGATGETARWRRLAPRLILLPRRGCCERCSRFFGCSRFRSSTETRFGPLMANRITVRSVTASVRNADGGIDNCARDTMPVEVLAAAAPWWTFRRSPDRRRYSGLFWSSTQHGYVIYGSRHELAVLLSADFDGAASPIVATPFICEPGVDGVIRRHVPDHLPMTDTGPVVDMKPRPLWTARGCGPPSARHMKWCVGVGGASR